MDKAELIRLARLGAKVRLAELHREVQAIHAAFPGLRSGRKAASVQRSSTSPTHRRRRMSSEARKRIADAQRKRWAVWKANQPRLAEGRAAGHARASGRSRKKK